MKREFKLSIGKVWLYKAGIYKIRCNIRKRNTFIDFEVNPKEAVIPCANKGIETSPWQQENGIEQANPLKDTTLQFSIDSGNIDHLYHSL